MVHGRYILQQHRSLNQSNQNLFFMAGSVWSVRLANTVTCADAPAEIRKLVSAGETFDVVIADPPYNIGKDFGRGQFAVDMVQYVDWVEAWLSDCRRLLTWNGLLYLYGFPEIVARISARFPPDEQRWLVWHYTNKTVPRSKFWQRSHETILCMWKPGGRRPVLEVDQIREPYTDFFLRNAAGKARKDTPSRFGQPGASTTYNAHARGALPRDVIKIAALAGGAGRKERWFVCRDCGHELHPPKELNNHRGHDVLKHPTQKPFGLTQKLIQSRIKGHGRVLIPFAGSGSECVVAKELGIEFRAFEINPEYVAFARKWLAHIEVGSGQCTV